MGRLLQHADRIRTRDGKLGTVVGVDLSHQNLDPEAGPRFIVDLDDGEKITVFSEEVAIITPSPASRPSLYLEPRQEKI
jgi:hypothetical protein